MIPNLKGNANLAYSIIVSKQEWDSYPNKYTIWYRPHNKAVYSVSSETINLISGGRWFRDFSTFEALCEFITKELLVTDDHKWTQEECPQEWYVVEVDGQNGFKGYLVEPDTRYSNRPIVFRSPSSDKAWEEQKRLNSEFGKVWENRK